MKNPLLKRALLMVMLISVTAAFFVSCASEYDILPQIQDDNGGTPAVETTGQEQEEEQEGNGRIPSDVPVMDFDGHEFRILTYAQTGNPVLDFYDVFAESLTGEIFNDAVFRRNQTIEERYNITITQIHSPTSRDDIQRSVAAGSDDFDLVAPRTIHAINQIASGLFIDLNEAPHLNLDMPWYMQSSIDAFTLGGRLFAVYSDMLISPYAATSLIIFNRRLQQDHGLEDPYQLVRDGRWTFDTLFDLARRSTVDLDGSGVMTIDDQHGFMSMNDSMAAFLVAGGGGMSRFAPDGMLEWELINDRNISIMDRAFTLLYDDSITINIQRPEFSAIGNAPMLTQQLVTNENVVFAWTRLGNIPTLRAMEADFGMLPMPKFDEQQQNFYSMVSPWQAMAMAIPMTVTDLERTSIIMEAMSWESMYETLPVYLETTLRFRAARDEESAGMLDYIFANTVIDPIMSFNFADVTSSFLRLAVEHDRNLQSFYEQRSMVVEEAIRSVWDLD